ncbi:MAG: 3-hydroxyalkanoate synthetase, partial [Pseudomonadota bacterium]|nr:3-hydroxyalkanoate synthetase [Pseudomonadota bacterium]
STSLSEFKRLVREQFFILKLDREQALNTLPELLKGQTGEEIDNYISHLEHVFAASGELTEHAANRFDQVKALFDKARPGALAAPAPETAPTSDPTAATAEIAAEASNTVTAEKAQESSVEAPKKKPATRPAGQRRSSPRKR